MSERLRTPPPELPAYIEGPDMDACAAGAAVAGALCALAFACLGDGGWSSLVWAGLGAGVGGYLGHRTGTFRLRLDPEGPWLEKSALGVRWLRLALPAHLRVRREGLLDWGLDGEDGDQALAGLSLEGPSAPMDPLLLGTRDLSWPLTEQIEAALGARYPGCPALDWARLAHNRPWPMRMQAWLASRLGGYLQRRDDESVTLFAGLIEWEHPSLAVFAAGAGLSASLIASMAGAEAVAFASAFTVVLLSAWRALHLLRTDVARAERGPDGALSALIVERRWLGFTVWRSVTPNPIVVLSASWSSAHPLSLATWPEGTVLSNHVHVALDAEAAAKWTRLTRIRD